MVMRLMPSSPLAQVFSWSGTYISLRIDSNVLYSSRNPDDPYTYNNPGVCRVNGVATLTYPASSYHVVSVSKDISAYDAYPAIIGGYLPSAGRYVTGYYAEVIAFDKLISAADLRRIEFYLGKKYAIKLN